jgi:hypothetical protein
MNFLLSNGLSYCTMALAGAGGEDVLAATGLAAF